ncbi:hypothetical protein BHM03_00060024 [Ensete ventricosum]|nr:hypothetical protein BHM03_00060024 [Ensete ventricosum]
MKEKQQIWFGIARLDAQAVAEAGLPWPRLPLGRIRRCGCRRGELGVAVVDLEVIGAFAAFRQFSPLATGHCPSSLPIREITFLFFYSLSNDSFYYHLSVDNSAVKPQIPRGHPLPPSRTSFASFALKVTLSSSVQIYLFLLSNGSLSSTLKLGLLVCRLSLPPLDPVGFLNSSTEAFFITRPSSLCTTTIASAPTSSGAFPTPSTADDGFYTYSSVPSFLQPLLLCSLCREYLYGPPLIVSQCSAERA